MTNAPTEGDFQPDDMLQPLPEHVTDALEHGWADPAKALNLEDASDLLEPGYLSLENGYARLADGKIHVACLTKMPGVNGRMINWWFGWMINTTHYKWWHPQAHVWSDFEQALKDATTTLTMLTTSGMRIWCMKSSAVRRTNCELNSKIHRNTLIPHDLKWQMSALLSALAPDIWTSR
jgi:hypothetical protein